MKKMTSGITIAGNIIIDNVKTIECYPKLGMLANISSVSQAVGGCAPNTAIDLAKIDPNLDVSVIGRIGNDDAGKFLLASLDKYGVERTRVSVDDTQPTSFSDVMSLPSGDRTFFHAKGANSVFSPDHIEIDSLSCSIFHIGYILLLDSFDKPDPEYGTVMARLLAAVQAKGIKTSIDVVSSATADYKGTILPALKYADYAILNELESTALFDIEPYSADGHIIPEKIKQTAELMAQAGVKEKIVIHCKEAGFSYDVPTGVFTTVPSLNIPSEEIKGSVGAGDAFCAASLYSIYNGFDDKHLLEFASSAAACNLFAENSIDGMQPAAVIEKVAEKYGRKKM